MIDKSRPRKGQMYIEPIVDHVYTTPLGSRLISGNFFYTHTIPSGLANDNQSNRPRRSQMFIEPEFNSGYTNPLGSHLLSLHVYYKHTIPSGLTN